MNLISWLVSLVRDRTLVLLATVSVVLLTLGYQVRTSYLIDVGTKNDRPFTFAFNDPERVETIPFRWSRGTSQVVLPGLGSGAAGTLTLQLRAYRPDFVPPRVTVQLNGQPLGTVRPPDSFQKYSFDLVHLQSQPADLAIQIRSRTFSTANDPRPLGVMVDTVLIAPPEAWQWVMPAWDQVAWLTLGVLGLYLLLLALQSRRAMAFGIALAMLAGFTVLGS